MKENQCLFCKIVAGEIKSAKVYEDDKVLGFTDIHPLAEVHQVFIHKMHVGKNVGEMMDMAPEHIQDIFHGINRYTKQAGLDQTGFRVVTNIGQHGGQTIFHTHFHVLGGERLKGFGA